MVKFSPDICIYGLLQQRYLTIAIIFASISSFRLKAPDYH